MTSTTLELSCASPASRIFSSFVKVICFDDFDICFVSACGIVDALLHSSRSATCNSGHPWNFSSFSNLSALNVFCDALACRGTDFDELVLVLGTLLLSAASSSQLVAT